MITSTKNPRIQQIRKLQSSSKTRRQENLFVIEGVRLVEEAYLSDQKPDLVLFTEGVHTRGKLTIEKFESSGVEVIPVAPHVMKSACSTRTPQGILAIMPIVSNPAVENLDIVIILDAIRDPGNLGTILRTSLAAGANAVILPPGSADPYEPKVIRAAMGAHFRLPIYQMEWSEIITLAKSNNLVTFLADSTVGLTYQEANFLDPLILIIGGEAAGAGEESRKMANYRVHIPMKSNVESLNSAVAAGILMFEIANQRRPQAGKD